MFLGNNNNNNNNNKPFQAILYIQSDVRDLYSSDKHSVITQPQFSVIPYLVSNCGNLTLTDTQELRLLT